LNEADNEQDDIEKIIIEEDDNPLEVIALPEVEADNEQDDIEKIIIEEDDNPLEDDILEIEEINFDNLDDDHQFENNDNDNDNKALYIEDIIETEENNINIEDVGKVDVGKKEQQSTTIYNDYNTSLHSHSNIKMNVYEESYINVI